MCVYLSKVLPFLQESLGPRVLSVSRRMFLCFWGMTKLSFQNILVYFSIIFAHILVSL